MMINFPAAVYVKYVTQSTCSAMGDHYLVGPVSIINSIMMVGQTATSVFGKLVIILGTTAITNYIFS